jgi:hypothetical protein
VEDAPEVLAAKDDVTTTEQQDHDLLQASAGKILGICGSSTPVPTAS